MAHVQISVGMSTEKPTVSRGKDGRAPKVMARRWGGNMSQDNNSAEEEKTAWEVATRKGNSQAYQEFLEKYPNSFWATTARLRLEGKIPEKYRSPEKAPPAAVQALDEAGSEPVFGILDLLLSVRGRISRVEYLISILIIGFLLTALFVMFFLVRSPLGFILLLPGVVILGACIAILVKRLHDRNRSGWFILITLVPIIGPLWLIIEVVFLRGAAGGNRFGPDSLDQTRRFFGIALPIRLLERKLLLPLQLIWIGSVVVGNYAAYSILPQKLLLGSWSSQMKSQFIGGCAKNDPKKIEFCACMQSEIEKLVPIANVVDKDFWAGDKGKAVMDRAKVACGVK